MLWLSWPFGTTGLVSGFVAAVLLLMFSRLFYAGPAAEQRHPQPQQSLDSGTSAQPEQSEKQGKQGPKNYVRDTSMGVFILTWIPLFGSFAAMMSLLRGYDDVPGSMFIITFMLCVIASDTGGYIAGVMFGSHPMAPTVSPKKSWEGFARSTISSDNYTAGNRIVGVEHFHPIVIHQTGFLGIDFGNPHIRAAA